MGLGYSGLTSPIGHVRFRTSRPNLVSNVQDFQSPMDLRGSQLPGPIGSGMITTNQTNHERDCIGSVLLTNKQDYQARMSLTELV